jgi:hypothetical protein
MHLPLLGVRFGLVMAWICRCPLDFRRGRHCDPRLRPCCTCGAIAVDALAMVDGEVLAIVVDALAMVGDEALAVVDDEALAMVDGEALAMVDGEVLAIVLDALAMVGDEALAVVDDEALAIRSSPRMPVQRGNRFRRELADQSLCLTENVLVCDLNKSWKSCNT